MKVYKILNADGSCRNGGSGKWFLPTTGKPGKWMPTLKGRMLPCRYGYHLTNAEHFLGWAGLHAWEAEYRGAATMSRYKIVVREARLLRKIDNWNDRTIRLLACDYAEHVAHLSGNKKETMAALRVVRKYANGKASVGDLRAARDKLKLLQKKQLDSGMDGKIAYHTLVMRETAFDAALAATTPDCVPVVSGLTIAQGAAEGAREAVSWSKRKLVHSGAREAKARAAAKAEKLWQTKQLRQYLRGKL